MTPERSTSIMRVLIWKEMRQQALIAVSLSLLPVLVCAGASRQSGGGVGIAAAVVLYWVLPLVLATNAFAGEQESGTARFLSALPVRSWKLFLSKYLVAVGLSVVGFLPVGLVLSWALVWGGYELPMRTPEAVLTFLGGAGALLVVCALPALSAMIGGGVIFGLCIYPAIAGAAIGCGLLCFETLHRSFGLSELAAGVVCGVAFGVWLGGGIWCWCNCRMMRVRRRFAFLWTGGSLSIPVVVGFGVYAVGVMAGPGGVFPLKYSSDVDVTGRRFCMAPAPDGRALLTQETIRRWSDGTRTVLWPSGEAEPKWLSRFGVVSIWGRGRFFPKGDGSWRPETPWSPDGSKCIVGAPGRPLAPVGLWLTQLLTERWPVYFSGPTVLDVATGHERRLPPWSAWRWLDEGTVWAPEPDGNIRFLEVETGRETVVAEPKGVVRTTDERYAGLPLDTALVRGGRVFSCRFRQPRDGESGAASVVACAPDGTVASQNFEHDWAGAWPRVEDINSVGETAVVADICGGGAFGTSLPVGCRVYILSFAKGTVREIAPWKEGNDYWWVCNRGVRFVMDETRLLISASELSGLALLKLPEGNVRPVLDKKQVKALRLPTLVWHVAVSPDRRRALVHLGCHPQIHDSAMRAVVAVTLESGELTTLWQSDTEAVRAEWWGNDRALILTRQGLWEVGVDGDNKRQLLP